MDGVQIRSTRESTAIVLKADLGLDDVEAV
jgi:hypothetical protein